MLPSIAMVLMPNVLMIPKHQLVPHVMILKLVHRVQLALRRVCVLVLKIRVNVTPMTTVTTAIRAR